MWCRADWGGGALQRVSEEPVLRAWCVGGGSGSCGESRCSSLWMGPAAVLEFLSIVLDSSPF